MPKYDVLRVINEGDGTEWWEISESNALDNELDKIHYEEEYVDYQRTPDQKWSTIVKGKDYPDGYRNGHDLIMKDLIKPEALKIEFNKRFQDYFKKIKVSNK